MRGHSQARGQGPRRPRARLKRPPDRPPSCRAPSGPCRPSRPGAAGGPRWTGTRRAARRRQRSQPAQGRASTAAAQLPASCLDALRRHQLRVRAPLIARARRRARPGGQAAAAAAAARPGDWSSLSAARRALTMPEPLSHTSAETSPSSAIAAAARRCTRGRESGRTEKREGGRTASSGLRRGRRRAAGHQGGGPAAGEGARGPVAAHGGVRRPSPRRAGSR